MELILSPDSCLILQEQLLKISFHNSEESLCRIELRCSCWEKIRPEVILYEIANSSGDSKMGRVSVHYKDHLNIRFPITS